MTVKCSGHIEQTTSDSFYTPGRIWFAIASVKWSTIIPLSFGDTCILLN